MRVANFLVLCSFAAARVGRETSQPSQQRQQQHQGATDEAECREAQRALAEASDRLNRNHSQADGTDVARRARDVASLVTIAIKTISTHISRRASLDTLLRSIRRRYGARIRVLVADDGDLAAEIARDPPHGAEWIVLPRGSGLSAGRNALSDRTRTPLVLFADDDVKFDESSRIETLLDFLEASPEVAIAAGCYAAAVSDGVAEAVSCYTHRFFMLPGGDLRMDPIEMDENGECTTASVAHNFFLGRTGVLRAHGWDERMKMGEHEAFFYALHLNSIRVVSCPAVRVLHDSNGARRPAEYNNGSLRLRTADYYHYFCKDFPEVRRFASPYYDLDCEARVVCKLDGSAEFIFEEKKRSDHCVPLPWGSLGDVSWVARPLVAPGSTIGSTTQMVSSTAPAPSRKRQQPPKPPKPPQPPAQTPTAAIPLLILILTQPSHSARREELRKAWLRRAWRASHRGSRLVPFRYAFVMGAASNGASSSSDRHASNGTSTAARLLGDVVVLRQSMYDECDYRYLVYKVIHMIQWAVDHVPFGLLLKCDDDSVVHIGRLWQWLTRAGRTAWPLTYAGRVVRNGTVIRPLHHTREEGGTRRASDRHIFTPAERAKWGVSRAIYAPTHYPPYVSGGGYLLGHTAALRILRASRRWSTSVGALLPVEDAYVGVLAAEERLVPVHVPRFVDMDTVDATEDMDAPLSTAILIHGAMRWKSAEVWSRSRVVSTGRPKLIEHTSGHSDQNRPLLVDGCDCSVRKPSLCSTRGSVEHGCWYACCGDSLQATDVNLPFPRSADATASADGRAHECGGSRYLILSFPRSGSTTLCWALSQHTDVVCNYELLSGSVLWEVLSTHLQLFASSAVPPRIPTEVQMRSGKDELAAALDVYWREHCKASACGFKLFPDQANWDALGSYLLRESKKRRDTLEEPRRSCGVKLILLRRRNTRAAYESYRRSLFTQDWHRTPGHVNLSAEAQRASSEEIERQCKALASKQHASAMQQNPWQQDRTAYRCSKLAPSFAEYMALVERWYLWALEVSTTAGLRTLQVHSEDLFEPHATAAAAAATTAAARRRAAALGSAVLATASKTSRTSASELNLTLLNRIASFLEVAPVFRRDDVAITKIGRPDWYVGNSVGSSAVFDAIEKAKHTIGSTNPSYKRLQSIFATGGSDAHAVMKLLLLQKPPSLRTLLSCYARRHDDLLMGYCRGRVNTCNWPGLEWHIRHKAVQEQRALVPTIRCACEEAEAPIVSSHCSSRTGSFG